MLKETGSRMAAAVLIVLVLCAAARAQSSLGIGSAEPSISTDGFFGGFFAWINALQQQFYRAMTDALAALRQSPAGVAGLVGLSFAYGVFHAAGPGHGKAVISAYMLANEVALRRGIVLSFASALLQGLVAIVVVGAAYLVLRGTAISMTEATRGLEIMSFALVTAFGAWLLSRKLGLTALQRTTQVAYGPHLHADQVSDGGNPDSSCHHHHGHSSADCACGHVHAADPSRLAAKHLSTGEALSAVWAVGLRPCSGALIVMTFALINGLYLGGALSVLAMSIGTAITVSILATLAVSAKGVAVRYSTSNAAQRVSDGIEVFGALCVFVIGATLLTAALY